MARRVPKVYDARERLLNAAIEVFADQGFASTSVADITDRAGLTRGAFYYYFQSKMDLAADLQRALWSDAAERAKEVFDPEVDTVTNLKRAFEVHLETLADVGLAREFLRAGFLEPMLEEQSNVERDVGVKLLQDVIVEAIDKGEIVPLDPGTLADILTELFEVSTLNVLRSNEPRATLAVVEALLDGLIPDKSFADPRARVFAPT